MLIIFKYNTQHNITVILITLFVKSDSTRIFQIYYGMNHALDSLYESNNLLASFEYDYKYNCFNKCNQYDNCTMVMINLAYCNIYFNIQYNYLVDSYNNLKYFNKKFDFE